MAKFSALNRVETIQKLETGLFDLLIIGGGITGAGIALDAITRGLKVALVEMQDFAEGTSSRSTKLVHGGLRYLKHFEIKEVAELGRERAIVYENGPHVTTPIWMLLPFHQGGTFGAMATSLGLKIYDILANVKKSEKRIMLSREETIKKEPLIKQEGLLGGGVYVEYRTDDARLTIEVLKAAVDRGALVTNYMKVIGIKKNNIAFTTVEIEDQLKNEKHLIKAKKVVNAAGPWVDHVRTLDDDISGKHLILSKGVHIVVDQTVFPLRQAVYFDTSDGRMVFAIPRGGKTYVGTTDTIHNGEPTDLTISIEDKRYLLEAIQYMFPNLDISVNDIESGWVGVRPLIHEEGKEASEISRKDEIWQSEKGLITIAGGKLTGYRKMAQKIVNLVVKQLEAETGETYGKCITKKLPISGGDIQGSVFFEKYIQNSVQRGKMIALTEEESEHLSRMYGSNIDKVFSFVQEGKSNLPPVIYAQLYYSVEYECVFKPVDFFIRRTGTMFFNIDFVESWKEAILDEMSEIFSWTVEEKEKYMSEIELEIMKAKGQLNEYVD